MLLLFLTLIFEHSETVSIANTKTFLSHAYLNRKV